MVIKGNGQLMKLKSVLKKLNSFNRKSKQLRSRSNVSAVHSHPDHGDELHEVFVGKSGRRYLVGSDVINHPLIRQLAGSSSDGEEAAVITTVPCEVVLFDHLLWMLENAEGPDGADPMDELFGFYAC